jgi:endonuclease YncB( thermonuclease family)
MSRRLRLGLGRRRWRRTSLASLLVVVAAAALLAYYGFPQSESPPARPSAPDDAPLHAVEGEVLRVVDGDTFEVIYKGDRDKVRFVDIAAAEMDEPGGPEAKQALTRLLEGKVVRLEIDRRRPRDSYGRILAKVYLGDVDVGRRMIDDGFAEVYRPKKR